MSESEYKQAYQREKRARRRAEELVEEKNLSIYHLRQDLLEARQEVETQQETLIQADKLKSVGLLASGITHEINNPLAFITSNMKLLSHYYTTLSALAERELITLDNSPPHAQNQQHSDQHHDLKIILDDTPEILIEIDEGLKRISRIVSNVKRFARKNARGRSLADINQEIAASVRLVGQQLQPNTEITLAVTELPLVSCNINEIGQVIINLLLNADQAMPATGGKIALSTVREGGCVLISCKDEGAGIPQELLESIFDPFFTTKPVDEGTGLGLSISYSIIEDHGGNISVASEEGVGTTFTIVLPID